MKRHCDATYLLDDANPDIEYEALKRLLAVEKSLHRKSSRDVAARRTLRRVESALGRIGCGTWGHCASCGARIDDERLAAHPEVETCRECGLH